MLVMLKATPLRGSAAVFDLVSREFQARHDTRWLAPLGFENTYAMSIRTEMAQRMGLRTLSDFARVSPQMRAGFTADFIGLPDGLPGLRAAYGLAPREVRALAPAVKYQALAAGEVDIIDAYSTDGLLQRYPLTVLVDDKQFFPPVRRCRVGARGCLPRAPRSRRRTLGVERTLRCGAHAAAQRAHRGGWRQRRPLSPRRR